MSNVGAVAVPPIVIRALVPVTDAIFASVNPVPILVPVQTPVTMVPTAVSDELTTFDGKVVPTVSFVTSSPVAIKAFATAVPCQVPDAIVPTVVIDPCPT